MAEEELAKNCSEELFPSSFNIFVVHGIFVLVLADSHHLTIVIVFVGGAVSALTI